MTSEERYKNGKIYTIRYRGDDNLIYVGSTCLPLYKRWHNHKKTCFNENLKNFNLFVYKKIRETNDFENWYIELYEEFECENKEQLLKREGEIIREIGTLNTQIAGRTIQEYYIDNKEQIKEIQKRYHNENKDNVSKKQHEYYLKNKDAIMKKHKEWNEKNKEQLYLQQKEMVLCNCGCSISKRNISTHKKTQKHLDLINSSINASELIL
jgi:hypothetical protein